MCSFLAIEDETLEDIAVLTAGTMIAEDLGIKPENVTLQMLGKAKRMRIEKENTTIIDGAGSKKDIEARIAQIKAQIEDTTSDYDREKLQERLAKLAGGVAGEKVPTQWLSAYWSKSSQTYLKFSDHSCGASRSVG